MSFVVRAALVNGAGNGVGSVEYYNPSDAIAYNAPYTIMTWARLSEHPSGTFPRGMIAHVGRRDVGGWDAFDSMGDIGTTNYCRINIGPRDGTNYYIQYNTTTQVWNTTTGVVAPCNPQFAQSGDPLWHVPWNNPSGGYYRAYTSWVHYALVRESGTLVKLYMNGTLVATANHASFPLTRSAANSVLFGGRYINSAYRKQGTYQDATADCKWAYARVFATALTQAQIAVEMSYTRAGGPDGGGSAWADWPLVSDYQDISGNGRHLALGYGMPATAYDANAAEYFKWDEDAPAGLLDPTPPVVGLLRGTTRAFPQLAGSPTAFPTIDGSHSAYPALSGETRVFILPE